VLKSVLKLLIETPGFPIKEVDEASRTEKLGGGRPDFWEMVFWWTRKPLAGARAVIAGAALPGTININEFIYRLRLGEKTAHRFNPNAGPWIERFKKLKLLDPFAGFGSIPLEAIRLGVGEVVAVELLPVAYVFLRAVLEYPKWAVDKDFGKKLVDDVKKWGEWIVKQLKQDLDIKELYDEDVAVYIGTWEIKCPHCSKWTLVVGNWWLARVRRGASEEEEETEEGTGRGVYERLAWIEPVVVGDEVAVKIVDLNKELNRRVITASVNTRAGTVTVEGRTYRVPLPNIDARREVATCLHCGNQIRKGKSEWYVKEALRDWNTKLEQYLSGVVTLEELLSKSLARPRLLAKVKIVSKELVFEPASKQDTEKLWRALEKLKAMWGDPDIPTEELWKYTASGGGALSIWIWGFNKFYKLFNPRQLLALVKLVKLIREAGKKIEEEKIREGWSREDAHKYAEAVTTYLAIALARFVDHNNIVTLLHPSNPMGIEIAHALSMRGIAMQWNWGDTNPLITTRGILRTNSWSKCLEKEVDALAYLINAVSGSPSRVRVLLDDATTLSKLSGERFDLIVTDPPYRDDVPYAELSDFYYVWLKRALSDVVDVGGILVRRPRFAPEAFFDEFSNEVEVQWKRFASREVSEDEYRSEVFGSVNIGGKSAGVGSFDYFKYLLSESFKAMASRLSDGGVLITYYAHTSPDAWEALLEAGWIGAGLRVSAAHALATESPQRVTARGATTLDMSIVVVWRGGAFGEALADEVYAKAVEVCSDEATRYRKAGYSGVNLFVSVLGCTLSQFTQYKRIIGVRDVGELVEKYIYPATAAAIARSLTGAEARLSPASQFYLLAKVLIDRGRRRRRRLDRTSATILAIGTRTSVEQLRNLRVVERANGDVVLMEPEQIGDIRMSIEELLREKNLNPTATVFRTSIDALHVLEYLALILISDEFRRRVDELRARNAGLIEEAIEVAKILVAALPEEEVERRLTQRLLDSLGIKIGGLFEFARR
jgi:Adenine-specific DNA methylase containing a Zn-ribbon